ncbi:MAG: hypothetical protein IJI36_17620 [Kiritimatiellae bacterium]|nr:hypothetical protein [Kiritimatiellia bacterium]
MPSRSFFSILFVAVSVATVPQAVIADGTDDSAETIVQRLKESVLDNWEKLSKWSRQTVDLHAELPSLPESAWFSADQTSQRKKIREKLLDIRKLLLSTDAQRIMRRIDAIDDRLAEIDEDMREETEQRVLRPEKRAKIDERLSTLRETRNELARQRESAAHAVLKELDALGLRLSGAAAEQCLFTVNVGDLIDNVIVAKNIGLVVENLRELMATGDVTAAKRYFGMYRVMVEVQKVCFDDYLEKSRDGEWRKKLNQIRDDATAARQNALDSAQDMSFSEQQRAVFRRNAEVNVSTLNAVAAYVRILDQHEAIIQAKADEAAKMLLVAENSYATVSLAGDFLALVKSSQDSFDALLQLQLPPIEIFNDAALQTEFMALTKKLKE